MHAEKKHSRCETAPDNEMLERNSSWPSPFRDY